MMRPGTLRRPTRCRWRCWCCWRASRLSSEPCCCFTMCSTTGIRRSRRSWARARTTCASSPARARRHVQQRRPRFQTTREQRDELARRFFAAAEHGDLAGLEALLAHDVTLAGDGGGKVPALARSLRGRNRVAGAVISWVRRIARLPGVSLRPVEVNGGPGALFLDGQQRLIGVCALDIADGQITSISGIVNPDKLTHLGPVADLRSPGENGERRRLAPGRGAAAVLRGIQGGPDACAAARSGCVLCRVLAEIPPQRA